MVDIATLGIQVNSQPAVKAVGDLDRLTAAAGKADVAADRLATNTGKVGPAMAGAGQNSRMFAMQLSQVAQQTSATGNFVQALAIQLPDMALGFGAVGIAAGVVASVALPTLAAAFMDTGAGARELEAALSAMDSAVADFASAVQDANAPTEELIEKYGRLAEVAQRALAAMADVQLVETITAVSDGIAQALDQLTVFGKEGFFLQGDWVRVLRDDFDLSAQAAQRLGEAVRALDGAQGLQAQAIAADRVRQELMAAYGSVEAMPGPIQAAYAALAQAAAQAAEANQSLSEMPGFLNSAADAAAGVQAAVGGIAGAAQTAADAVANLAARMWDAAQARMAAEGNLEAMAMEFSPAGQALDKYGGRGTPTGTGEPRAPRSFGGGGGGGGGTDQYAADLEALTESLQTERETLDLWYEESQLILEDRRAMEILGAQAHQETMLALEAEYQQRLLEIDQEVGNSRLALAEGIFGGLADFASAAGARGEKAARAFGAAEALINVYRAQAQVLGDPKLSFFQKIPAMLAVGAAGMRVVSAIRSGGSGGSAGGGGTIAAQGQQQAQQQTVEFMVRGIDRDALYTGEMFARIFDGLTEEAQKRGMQTAVRFV